MNLLIGENIKRIRRERNIDEDKNHIPKTKKYNGFVLKPLYLVEL